MNTMQPEQLARLLGIPLFRTPHLLPDYPPCERGSWRISRMATGIDHGYYTRQWVVSGMPVLLRSSPDNAELWETWMSLTPHEIESQEPGCLCAHGHTVIMGLGMGWIALNAALNPAVRRVTVVERDPDVIELYTATGVACRLPEEIGAKIVIARADALEWRPDEPVDFLYADIWRTIANADTLADVRCMQRQAQVREIYFWGQELRLFTAHRQMFGPEAPLTDENLRRCISREIKLPLILPWGNRYPELITAAVRNRQARGLPLEEPASPAPQSAH